MNPPPPPDVPITPQEIKELVKSLPPDKSPGVDGIFNRILQAGGENFGLTLIFPLESIWDINTYPEQWTFSLMQPIYKGNGKDRKDPASERVAYRGIRPTFATTKLLEGLINNRLYSFITENFRGRFTPFQFGFQKNTQTYDAQYTLTSVIRNNATHNSSATYCAFINFSSADPASHKEQLTLLLHTFGIQGKLWKILQETYRKVNIRVLHPVIPDTECTTLMRGLPEGSKLSPPLFGILVADRASSWSCAPNTPPQTLMHLHPPARPG